MENRPLIHHGNSMPMAYPSGKSKITQKGNIMAGDVGGTKTNLAIFQIQEGQLLKVKQETYSTKDSKRNKERDFP